ncbi:MAG: DMT family transporter [Gammaproteobacteria bacterium]|nr:DMT family transporter [Gammaproteobacteria bacterium]MDD9869914.1 DMT family transporter [Gammaproteobacteria bacterium]
MNQKLGILFVFIAAMAWSTAGLFTRVVTTDIPTTLFWRSLIGGLCVLGIYLCMRRRRSGRPLLRDGLREAFCFSRGELVIGALSTAGMICFISSFFHTTIANVSFVYGSMPLVTFLLALLALKERADWVALASCVLCAVGVAVMIGGAQKFDDLFGIGLAFGMTFFMASLTIAAKYFPAANVVKATYFSGFLGALVMLPFSSFIGTLQMDYFWLSLYGLANLGLGFGVYLLGVQRVTATTAALVGLSEIPIAPVWAWLLFAENPGANTVIGGAIMLAATTYYLVVQYLRQRPNLG